MSTRYGVIALASRHRTDFTEPSSLRAIAGIPEGCPVRPGLPSSPMSHVRHGTFGWGLLSTDRDWTLICGEPFLGWGTPEQVAEAITQADPAAHAVHWGVEGASGAIGFTVIREGVVRRSWWEVQGSVWINVGRPLDEEPRGRFTWSPDLGSERGEWEVVSLVEMLVAPWEMLTATVLATFRTTDALAARVS